ncbi:hypothetical protein GMOD_00009747 [Pyrenophora seminiperda CCB06]|uniref:Uncharacterized protein n=1 Tax=Pyrenophora seminiperda CCB06 TaxID=1302712 RepID=A0A3M7MEV0_9PLEO|nr:hypothetical protein GMOD_00009747 [Pyrenophora seminiperda CCB06]
MQAMEFSFLPTIIISFSALPSADGPSDSISNPIIGFYAPSFFLGERNYGGSNGRENICKGNTLKPQKVVNEGSVLRDKQNLFNDVENPIGVPALQFRYAQSYDS